MNPRYALLFAAVGRAVLLLMMIGGVAALAKAAQTKPDGTTVVTQRCTAVAFKETADSTYYQVQCPKKVKLVVLP